MSDFISVRAAAEQAGVSTAAIYKAIRQGRLIAYKVLDRVALKSADLDAFQFRTYGSIGVICEDKSAYDGKTEPEVD